ncbi:Serine carboxypeptidase-like 2, partial [Dichanthelium oligosanthes]
PLKFDVAGYTEGFPQLLYFDDAWTKVSNIIFLDAPVGTGFSYAREEAGYNLTLTGLGRHLHTFLRKWLAEHEELASNPLYIGGDSYSGYTVPVAAIDIANNNGNDQETRLNLKGYLVGNPLTDERYEKGGKVPFMHGMGLISEELYEAAVQGCGGDFYNMPEQSNTRCANALKAIDLVTSDINPVHILEPFCGKALRRGPGVRFFQGHGGGGNGRRSMLVRDNVEHPDFFSRRNLNLPVECRDNGYRLAYIWADEPEVRVALGIHAGSIGSWSRCTDLTHFTTDLDTVIPHHVNLTKAGYRALIYSGDHDLDVTFVGTQAWIRSLKYPIVSDWRPWHSNRQVAGFTRTYAYNLTYTTVKGAGHTAPEYRPKECLDMLYRWMSPGGQL